MFQRINKSLFRRQSKVKPKDKAVSDANLVQLQKIILEDKCALKKWEDIAYQLLKYGPRHDLFRIRCLLHENLDTDAVLFTLSRWNEGICDCDERKDEARPELREVLTRLGFEHLVEKIDRVQLLSTSLASKTQMM